MYRKTRDTILPRLLSGVFIALLGLSVAKAQDDEEIFTLSPFEVSPDSNAGYEARESTTASLIAMPLDQLAMNLNVINNDFIEDLQYTDFGDVLRFTPVSTHANLNDTAFARGFQLESLRNGFAPGGRFYLTANTERVEILKGPSSVLYGLANPGGAINYIPKLPKFEQETTLTASLGSFDHSRVMLDTTGPVPLWEGDKLAYRLILSYLDEGGPVDYQSREELVFAPSISFRPTSNLSFNFEYEYQDIDRAFINGPLQRWGGLNPDGSIEFEPIGLSGADRPAFLAGRERVRGYDNDKYGLGWETSVKGPEALYINENRGYTGEVTWTINDSTTLRYVHSDNERGEDRRSYFSLGRAVDGREQTHDRRLGGNEIRAQKLDLTTKYELGEWATGNLLVGFEENENFFVIDIYRATDANNAPISNPFDGPVPVSELLISSDISNFQFVRTGGPFLFEFTNARILNTLHAFDDRLHVMTGISQAESSNIQASGAVDRQTAGPYTLGVVFDVTEQFSLYAQQGQSFRNQFGELRNGDAVPPTFGEIKEVGVKFDLLGGKLNGWVSYFDQERNNISRRITIPDDPDTPEDEFELFNEASGLEGSKGVDYTVFYNPTENTQIMLNGAHFDGEVLSNNQNPDQVGLDLANSPENSVSVWASHSLSEGSLKGLTFGLGYRYSEGTTVDTRFNRRFLITDDITTVDLLLKYETEIQGRATTFSLKVDNLLDEENKIETAGNFLTPLEVKGSVKFKF